MDKKSINENKAIQEGLERFLDQELMPEEIIPAQTAEPRSLKARPLEPQTLKEPIAYSRPLRPEYPYETAYGEAEYEEELEVEKFEDDYRAERRKTSVKQHPQKKSQKPSATKAKKEKAPEAKPEKPAKKVAEKRSKKQPKKQPKKKSGWKKFLAAVLVLAAILIFVWYQMVGKVYKQMNYEKVSGLASEPMKQDGVINILLIGNDSRENGEDGRSDAMILLSVSNETKTIHMTSLLRDMYVEIPGHDGNRLNAAYAYGGPALLCETIEQNLGIEVNRYVLVNFQAFAALVDSVGGIDLEVTNEEVQWINAYLNEYNLLEGREMTADYLDTSLSGEIHLNGPQALAYSRNRYIGTDFGRTERQRKVLSAVIAKLPVAVATNGNELVEKLCPNLTTNLTQMEMFRLSGDATKLLNYEIIQTVIPAEDTYSNATIRGMSVLEVDFEANKAIIRKEIYGEE